MQEHRKQIREIPANPFLQNQIRGKRLRVAAYCRVSTEQEEQESSFENQVEYYTNLIQSNPEWECAGIFADRGISGTKDTIRPEFMRMIEECKRHKIDLILTKSLSRFSRNTLDSITYIRLLKSLNVAIEFEKEGLNTSDVSSEIYLTWFSAFAQAESESISQNVTMGKRRQYKEGKFAFHYSHFLGYRKGAGGEPEIEPEGAAVVTRIFYSFLGGDTPRQIAAALESDGILSPTGRTAWSPSTIQNILRNEKYAGDVLLQKTYTSDFLQKKVKKTGASLHSITSRTIIRRLYPGTSSRRSSWKSPEGTASGRFPAGGRNPSRGNIPANLPYLSGWSAGSAGRCTGGPSGSSGTGTKKTSGGASTGWNSGRNIAGTRPA